ncbi:MAG: type II secretion system protein [Lentisphaeria bacterium]|nr:type II secretion system protein [Lentisphaeria bacterium]
MKKKNFTLVELLCATALIVILAGIGFSAYSYASHRGKEAATKSLITRIGAGLETLKTKHGFYPAASSYSDIEISINSSTGLVDQISFGTTRLPKDINNPTDAEKKQRKDFLAVADGENLKKYVANAKLTDAWGGPIKYKYPGSINTVKFDLVAPGADGEFGRSPPPNAPPPASLADYQTEENDPAKREWACDDIANFK